MKINKKWIKRGLACIGIAAVGGIGYYLGGKEKLNIDDLNWYAKTAFDLGVRNGLSMVPVDENVIFTKEMLMDAYLRVVDNVKVAVDLEHCGVSATHDGELWATDAMEWMRY